MTAAKHTPPWRVASDLDGWSVSNDDIGNTCYQGIEDANGTIVAFAVAHDGAARSMPDSQPIADLIAVAPELLALLKDWREACGPMVHDELASLTDAAIAKATRSTT